MTTYARTVALVDADPALTIGTYTMGRTYEVVSGPLRRCDFHIIDDLGILTPCWWEGDPDVIWERVTK